jgi:hypothetical protein
MFKWCFNVCVRFSCVTLLYNCLELQFDTVSLTELKYSFAVSSISSSCLRLKLAAHFASLVLSQICLILLQFVRITY